MSEARKIIYLMGTKISLYLKAKEAERLIEKACGMLVHYETVFSANSPTSKLMTLNQTASHIPQVVDLELYELIRMGLSHSRGEQTFLNIAIGPLVKLWKVGFEGAGVPDQWAVDRALELIMPELIELNDQKNTVFFLKDGVEIDLGAIAKGYICDQIMAFFKVSGAESAMIDIGGNVLVFGDSPSGESTWKVGIQNPNLPRGNIVALVEIKNQSIVTSGIYERYFEINGHRYHHIFDKQTGYPMESHIASLSIIADQSLDCDLYTTKLFGLDAATIIREVNKIKGMSAIVITTDGNMAHTNDLVGKISFEV